MNAAAAKLEGAPKTPVQADHIDDEEANDDGLEDLDTSEAFQDCIQSPITSHVMRDRSRIQKSAILRDPNFICYTATVYEPKTYKQAVNGPDSKNWSLAIRDELDSLLKNHTWDIVFKPKDRKLVTSKWVFKY